MKIKVDRMKAVIASYWRYQKQCPFIALEASCQLGAFNEGGQADVLAINQHRLLIETEIKLTLADLRRDRNKSKHRFFRQNRGEYPTTYFYFAVPKDIANKVSMLCGNLYPYAGVLGTDGVSYYDVEVYRQPKILIAKQLSFLQITRMAREQGATICRLAEVVANYKQKGELA